MAYHNANIIKFLDLVSYAETRQAAINNNCHRFQIKYGGGRFFSYQNHPFEGTGAKNTPAGIAQFTLGTYHTFKKILKLTDFSPDSQIAIFEGILKECGVYDDVVTGNIEALLTGKTPVKLNPKTKKIIIGGMRSKRLLYGQWPSLPGGNQSNVHSFKTVADAVDYFNNTATINAKNL